MFLFRIVFWLAVVVMLLPTEERQQAKLYETAAATVERLATFCDRNPTACAAGAEAWSAFVKKAEFGARVAVDLITSQGQRADGGRCGLEYARNWSGSRRATLHPRRAQHADARRSGTRLARSSATGRRRLSWRLAPPCLARQRPGAICIEEPTGIVAMPAGVGFLAGQHGDRDHPCGLCPPG